VRKKWKKKIGSRPIAPTTVAQQPFVNTVDIALALAIVAWQPVVLETVARQALTGQPGRLWFRWLPSATLSHHFGWRDSLESWDPALTTSQTIFNVVISGNPCKTKLNFLHIFVPNTNLLAISSKSCYFCQTIS
jgi:hypothetical protein